MQQLSGTLRETVGDGALEISVLEGIKHIGLFRVGRVLPQFLPRERQRAVEHLLLERTKICGGVQGGRQDPRTPAHGSPVRPKTSLSRLIPSSTQALQIIGGNSLQLQYSQTLIKCFSAFTTFLYVSVIQSSVSSCHQGYIPTTCRKHRVFLHFRIMLIQGLVQQHTWAILFSFLAYVFKNCPIKKREGIKKSLNALKSQRNIVFRVN